MTNAFVFCLALGLLIPPHGLEKYALLPCSFGLVCSLGDQTVMACENLLYVSDVGKNRCHKMLYARFFAHGCEL